MSGLCLFFAYLAAVGGPSEFEATARQLAKQICQRFEAGSSGVTGIGAFAGLGGLIYLFAHLGVLWNEPEWFEKADQIVGTLPSLIEEDRKLDIVAGAAGCLGCLLCLRSAARCEKSLQTELCGERLIASALETGRGLGWLTQAGSNRVLAGFSHGNAGIAWALLELFRATGKERFRETAMSALAYERSLFREDQQNWPDLREYREEEAGPPRLSFPVAWCHGAAGIGLARLRSGRIVQDAEVGRELEVAVDTTLERGFGGNHSLCHGDLGNLDLLIQYRESGSRPEIDRMIDLAAGRVIDALDGGKPLCATPMHVETPGLMTGLSGIGYGLIRLAQPHLVPSVLTLDPPFLLGAKCSL